jgi:hypothetical protein
MEGFPFEKAGAWSQWAWGRTEPIYTETECKQRPLMVEQHLKMK